MYRVKRAVRNRVYTGKTHLRGFQNLDFSLVRGGGLCLCSREFYSLNALKKIPVANIDKVTLEFGIKVGGEAGIPYVTKGTAESNLKVTVECSFPDQPEKKTEQS